MKESVFGCFCSRQVKFVLLLIRMNFIKPVACATIKHPITGNVEIQIQKFRAGMIVTKFSQLIVSHLLDEEGKRRLQQLEYCGTIYKISRDDVEENSQNMVFKV